MIPPIELHTNALGQKTLLRTDLNETYHSRHGAIAESLHVFLENGLFPAIEQQTERPLRILEVGFGTGLNAMLTLLESEQQKVAINYESLETIPLSYALVKELGYQEFWGEAMNPFFESMHEAEWDQAVEITSLFSLQKHLTPLEKFSSVHLFHLIYFDAFAPEKQPELWTSERFQQLYELLHPGGILVTYSAKGEVRRTMQQCGFVVERLAGPPMKRHMLRAIKPKHG